MRCLVLDTSTERGVVAVIEDGKFLIHELLPFGIQSAQHLLPMLQKSLSTHCIELASIACIVAGVGPGSYTGIRIGATAAKTLAFALKIPVVGVCTLEGFVPSKEGPFAAVIDAKIGGFYVQMGSGQEPRVCSIAEAVELLKDVKVIVTPNASKIRPKLEAAANRTWEWEERYPSCENLVRIGCEKLGREGEGKLELMYLRSWQPQKEKDNKDIKDLKDANWCP